MTRRFVVGTYTAPDGVQALGLVDLANLNRGWAPFGELDSAEYAARKSNNTPEWADNLEWWAR